MVNEGGTWIRPRGQAWGNESQRAVLHAIAADVAQRSGHRVAAIEALRTDGHLEFVAIAGLPDARHQLLGRASPLALERLTEPALPLAGWLHIPGERLDDYARAWLDEYGHTPDVPPGAGPQGWRPDDQLVRLLTNDQGDLRAILYLDEPLSGLRPTQSCVAAINDEVGVMYDAIVSIVERESFGEHVRMLTQARTAMQSVRPGLGVDDFLKGTSAAMVETMSVDWVDFLLAGRTVASLEPHTADLAGQMHQVWLSRGHLVVEPTETWGYADDAVPTPEVLRTLMDRRGIGSWLLIPIGMGDEYLGTMALGRAHGGPRWVDSEINAAMSVASDLAGMIFGVRLVDRERALYAELRNISDYRNDMMMTLTHELRNPVTVLWTHLEMAAMQDSADPAGEESLAAMRRATNRIENMIGDMLTLASVSDPERELSHDPVDLAELVRDSHLVLEPVAVHSEVDLHCDLVDGLVVHGDATGLARVVTNLMSNAVKYTAAGGLVSVTVAPAAVDGTDGVRLTCLDTGFGIDAAEVEHVFRPFFRSGNTRVRRRPGTGLGLAIVERVVKHHHGSVCVESEIGQGTTFTVWLPLGSPDDVT